jgi:hypothetical protein
MKIKFSWQATVLTPNNRAHQNLISNLGIITYSHKNTDQLQEEFSQINGLCQNSAAAEFFI